MQTKVHKALNQTTPITLNEYQWKDPDDKVFVVAGNVTQFNHYLSKKRLEGSSKQYYYVHSPESLRGLSTIKGVFIGTWAKRLDIAEIREQITIIKTKMKYDEQISISAGILAQEIDKDLISTIKGNTVTKTGLTATQTLASSFNSITGSSPSYLTEASIRDMMKKYIDEALANPKTLGGI